MARTASGIAPAADAHVLAILEARTQARLPGSPVAPPSEIDLPVAPALTEAERHRLLVEWNDTDRDLPTHWNLHQHFEERVRIVSHDHLRARGPARIRARARYGDHTGDRSGAAARRRISARAQPLPTALHRRGRAPGVPRARVPSPLPLRRSPRARTDAPAHFGQHDANAPMLRHRRR